MDDRFFRRTATCLVICFFSLIHNAYAIQSYVKSWGFAVVTGSVKQNSNVKYYLQSDLRFISTRYVFNQFLLLGGLGYVLSPKVTLFGGLGRIEDKNTQGELIKENRLWLQFNWLIYQSTSYSLNSRSRWEANKNLDQPQIAYRLRQRFWLRIPIANWDSHSFSCYDEIFLNLNHPDWVSPFVFAQNRAFIGIGTQLTRSTIIDVGYLNQYLHSHQNQINHVFLIGLTINNA